MSRLVEQISKTPIGVSTITGTKPPFVCIPGIATFLPTGTGDLEQAEQAAVEQWANAQFTAEAFRVAYETGMSPFELWLKVRELEHQIADLRLEVLAIQEAI